MKTFTAEMAGLGFVTFGVRSDRTVRAMRESKVVEVERDFLAKCLREWRKVGRPVIKRTILNFPPTPEWLWLFPELAMAA